MGRIRERKMGLVGSLPRKDRRSRHNHAALWTSCIFKAGKPLRHGCQKVGKVPKPENRRMERFAFTEWTLSFLCEGAGSLELGGFSWSERLRKRLWLASSESLMHGCCVLG